MGGRVETRPASSGSCRQPPSSAGAVVGSVWVGGRKGKISWFGGQCGSVGEREALVGGRKVKHSFFWLGVASVGGWEEGKAFISWFGGQSGWVERRKTTQAWLAVCFMQNISNQYTRAK